MITSFADRGTEDIFNGADTKIARKTLDRTLWSVASRKLDYLNRARTVLDLQSPPGNRPEALKGPLKGKHSIRINDQFRIVFRFNTGQASEVEIIDYH